MKLNELLIHISFSINEYSQNPDVEAELILSYLLNKQRGWLILNHDLEIIEPNLIQKINSIIRKRQENIPLEYILKERFFYNSNFYVTSNVLIPRPETEILVDLILEKVKNSNNKKVIDILEIGTGSACIPISVLLEFLSITNSNYPDTINIISTDISKEAIKVAEKNKRSLLNRSILDKSEKNISFEIINADIINPLEISKKNIFDNKSFDLIISNPPYIPSKNLNLIDNSVKMEPLIALDGGEKGISIIDRIIEETHLKFKTRTGKFLFEIDSSSENSLKDLLDYKYINKVSEYKFHKDLTQKVRFIEITLN